jgi:hypothetical protein
MLARMRVIDPRADTAPMNRNDLDVREFLPTGK